MFFFNFLLKNLFSSNFSSNFFKIYFYKFISSNFHTQIFFPGQRNDGAKQRLHRFKRWRRQADADHKEVYRQSGKRADGAHQQATARWDDVGWWFSFICLSFWMWNEKKKILWWKCLSVRLPQTLPETFFLFHFDFRADKAWKLIFLFNFFFLFFSRRAKIFFSRWISDKIVFLM